MDLQDVQTPGKVKILVVEDDSDLQKILKLNLIHEGFEVLQAYDGAECFRILKDSRPDLILLDLMMPEMDGFEVCKRLKSVNLTSDIPVIIVTARETLQDKLKCFSFKADDYVVKPYEFEDLLARIYLHLNKIAEAEERRRTECNRLQRSTMRDLSEQAAVVYGSLEDEITALEGKLPAKSREELNIVKRTSLELISVVERMREQMDPTYNSPILEKVK